MDTIASAAASPFGALDPDEHDERPAVGEQGQSTHSIPFRDSTAWTSCHSVRIRVTTTHAHTRMHRHRRLTAPSVPNESELERRAVH